MRPSLPTLGAPRRRVRCGSVAARLARARQGRQAAPGGGSSTRAPGPPRARRRRGRRRGRCRWPPPPSPRRPRRLRRRRAAGSAHGRAACSARSVTHRRPAGDGARRGRRPHGGPRARAGGDAHASCGGCDVPGDILQRRHAGRALRAAPRRGAARARGALRQRQDGQDLPRLPLPGRGRQATPASTCPAARSWSCAWSNAPRGRLRADHLAAQDGRQPQGRGLQDRRWAPR